MRRKWIVSGLAGAGLLLAVIVWHTTGQGPASKPARRRRSLPIRQVVLFNSGVGYFQREGEVNGDARSIFPSPPATSTIS